MLVILMVQWFLYFKYSLLITMEQSFFVCSTLYRVLPQPLKVWNGSEEVSTVLRIEKSLSSE